MVRVAKPPTYTEKGSQKKLKTEKKKVRMTGDARGDVKNK